MVECRCSKSPLQIVSKDYTGFQSPGFNLVCTVPYPMGQRAKGEDTVVHKVMRLSFWDLKFNF